MRNAGGLSHLILFLPGMLITTWFGSQIQRQAAISPTVLVPFVLGIWMVAWSPVLPIASQVREL